MEWATLAKLSPLLIQIPFLAWVGHNEWTRRRRYRLDQTVWAHRDHGWELGRVTDEAPSGFTNIKYVQFFNDNKIACFRHEEIRPTRWWQHKKVDPIVARYWLLQH